MAMEDRERKPEWIEELREYFSPIISIISFWAIALFWNVVFEELETVPRLGFGAALSWIVFLHAEVIGMILMSIKRRRLQAETRAQAIAEVTEKARAEARREAQVETWEAQAKAREAQAATREAQAEAREAQAEAREARLEAREARLEAGEIIRDLERQLREARGEGANGA